MQNRQRMRMRMHGRGLKPGVNEADTGSVVGSCRADSKMGRMASGGNNNMVSANASRKSK